MQYVLHLGIMSVFREMLIFYVFQHVLLFCTVPFCSWGMYHIIVVSLKGSTWSLTCQPTPLARTPSTPSAIITSIYVWSLWHVLHKPFFTSSMYDEVLTNIHITIFMMYGTSYSFQISMQINSALPQNFLHCISIFNTEALCIWLYYFGWTLVEAVLTLCQWQIPWVWPRVQLAWSLVYQQLSL